MKIVHPPPPSLHVLRKLTNIFRHGLLITSRFPSAVMALEEMDRKDTF